MDANLFLARRLLKPEKWYRLFFPASSIRMQRIVVCVGVDVNVTVKGIQNEGYARSWSAAKLYEGGSRIPCAGQQRA